MPVPAFLVPLAAGVAVVSGVTAQVKRWRSQQRAPMWNQLADQFGVAHPPRGVEFLAVRCFDLRVQISRTLVESGGRLQIEVMVPVEGSRINVTAWGDGAQPETAKRPAQLNDELLDKLTVSGNKTFLEFLTPARQRALMSLVRDHRVFTLRPYSGAKKLGIFKVPVNGELDSPEMVERAGATAVKLAGHARAFVDG